MNILTICLKYHGYRCTILLYIIGRCTILLYIYIQFLPLDRQLGIHKHVREYRRINCQNVRYLFKIPQVTQHTCIWSIIVYPVPLLYNTCHSIDNLEHYLLCYIYSQISIFYLHKSCHACSLLDLMILL
jgi:hypothetical protein